MVQHAGKQEEGEAGRGQVKGTAKPRAPGMCVQNTGFNGTESWSPFSRTSLPRKLLSQFCPPWPGAWERLPILATGEDLGTCPPTCSEALPVLNAHTQTRVCACLQTHPASPRHTCVPQADTQAHALACPPSDLPV